VLRHDVGHGEGSNERGMSRMRGLRLKYDD